MFFSQLPEPENCDECGSLQIRFVHREDVHNEISTTETPEGGWPFLWFCDGCRATAGVHQGTRNPFGRFANRKTRRLRRKAHEAFDPLWQRGLMARDAAYQWLARQLDIGYLECHISQLNNEQLGKVIEIVPPYIAENEHKLIRRTLKKREKEKARNAREFRHESRCRAKR